MSYENKINSVKQIIEIHNQNAEEKRKINFETFLRVLQGMGGTTEESLSLCTWEDLETCGLPRLIARQVSQSIFRKNDANHSNNGSTFYYSEKKVQQMPIQDVVAAYNPKDPKNAIGKRLFDISNGKRCIIFTTEGKVNVSETVKMIEDINNGLDELDVAFVEGVPTPVYKVGERIDLYADENPLYPGRALRTGGVCDQTGRSWDGVSLKIKQLLYIAITLTKELRITDIDSAHSALDKAVCQAAEDGIVRRYSKAYLKYQELLKEGKLPVMKIKLGGSDSSKSNNPFYAQNKEF